MHQDSPSMWPVGGPPSPIHARRILSTQCIYSLDKHSPIGSSTPKLWDALTYDHPRTRHARVKRITGGAIARGAAVEALLLDAIGERRQLSKR